MLFHTSGSARANFRQRALQVRRQSTISDRTLPVKVRRNEHCAFSSSLSLSLSLYLFLLSFVVWFVSNELAGVPFLNPQWKVLSNKSTNNRITSFLIPPIARKILRCHPLQSCSTDELLIDSSWVVV